MSPLEEFCRSAARSYLQSVVFIDDHIFDQVTGMPTISPDEIRERKPILRPRTGTNALALVPPVAPSEQVQNAYHPKDMVSSFAREGIICALYEPQENFSTDPDSEIFKLCERPDIIILDWDFSGDRGNKALALIAALVKQSTLAFPHHMRLISIYTADQSLAAVGNQIADRLTRDGLDVSPVGAQCRLHSGATRLVVMGKPIGRFGEEEEAFTVKESDLAERLVREFADTNAGILPSVALHGLAAIRRNSKRILDRFHGDLDGAFLLHRAALSASEEAFHQLPDLVAEEMCAILEDDRLSDDEARDISSAALAGKGFPHQEKILIEEIGRKISACWKADTRKVTRKINNGGQVPPTHQRLAALFSSRTHYSQNVRRLGFGTIVRHRANTKKPWLYAICLVPACDSLRCIQPVRFPFWTLKEDLYTGDSRRRGFVLEVGGGNLVSLTASGSAGEMFWTESFEVDDATRTVVARMKRGVFKYFGSKKRIEWIGQLKPLHAHRIARDITEALSRVGLNEAEWIRVLCTPSS